MTGGERFILLADITVDLYVFPSNLCTEGIKSFFDFFVASVDMIDSVNGCSSIGGEGGEDEGG